MLPELGNFALIVALAVALLQSILPLCGALAKVPAWMAFAKPAAYCQLLLILTAFIILTQAFIGMDFSVAYVAENSNRQLPLHYRVAAVWGGHAGSLLLWALMLAGWGAAVARTRRLPAKTHALTLSVLAMIAVGFLLFMLLTSNPFARLWPAPVDGRDLNPLLQDIGLVLHPPMLYLGYVGFSVAFALAMAALIDGKLDAAWARAARPWTNAAWAFLTIGIALGSWWAYYELGWGGWWFWDPVENASFMPWLAGAALLHSLAATEQRGVFKSWTVLLAVLAFSLSLLGTFLVRSGVLNSVHAFAADPARGLFILIFLGVVSGGALTLYAWRAPRFAGSPRFSLGSREMAILMNNILLGALCFAVLLGTLYPLILDALSGAKISVGPPYFDFLFASLGAPLLLCMGIGVYLKWKQDQPRRWGARLAAPFGIAVFVGCAPPLWMPYYSFGAALGGALGGWVICTAFASAARPPQNQARARGWNLRMRYRISRATVGMRVAHIGVGVFVIGAAYTNIYSVEKEFSMAVGDTVQVAGHAFQFHGVTRHRGANYQATRGKFTARKSHAKELNARPPNAPPVNGPILFTLWPEKRAYASQHSASRQNSTAPAASTDGAMTEAAIDAGIFRDFFIALGEPLNADGDVWSARIHYKPLVRWIWCGALLMAVGGGLAAGRRRVKLSPPNNAVAPANSPPT